MLLTGRGFGIWRRTPEPFSGLRPQVSGAILISLKAELITAEPKNFEARLVNGRVKVSQSGQVNREMGGHRLIDYYSGIGIGDLNGDGIPDVVYAGTFGVQSYLAWRCD